MLFKRKKKASLPEFREVEFNQTERQVLKEWRDTELWNKLMVHLDYQLVSRILGCVRSDRNTKDLMIGYQNCKSDLNGIPGPDVPAAGKQSTTIPDGNEW